MATVIIALIIIFFIVLVLNSNVLKKIVQVFAGATFISTLITLVFAIPALLVAWLWKTVMGK